MNLFSHTFSLIFPFRDSFICQQFEDTVFVMYPVRADRPQISLKLRKRSSKISSRLNRFSYWRWSPSFQCVCTRLALSGNCRSEGTCMWIPESVDFTAVLDTLNAWTRVQHIHLQSSQHILYIHTFILNSA